MLKEYETCEIVGYCPYNNQKEGFPCPNCPYEKDGGYHEMTEEEKEIEAVWNNYDEGCKKWSKLFEQMKK
jgi:hypothetical protein